ncbi:MAG TPA: OsmC family protein [Candidatus Limnocylindria bacterium]|jgi:putative redox protein|nr:OsmC family protein [Candidatus Limnocylindria bacterium]
MTPPRMRSVSISWDGRVGRFSAVGSRSAHTITVNGPSPPGEDRPPNGFSATELLLAGAGACSAWDVVEILRKQRAELTALAVTVEGRQASAQPWHYEHVALHFRLAGAGLRPGVVKRVVRLSIERYCSVVATIRGVAAIEATVEIVAADGTTSGRLPVDLRARAADSGRQPDRFG